MFVVRLLAAVGLAEMCLENYKNAARYFLQLTLDAFEFPEILSAHGVAIYAGLCSLATFDRTDLNTKVSIADSLIPVDRIPRFIGK